MNTFTVHLENHDDVVSTIDKLSYSRARRFLLVWPKRSRLMQSRLDLVLIQRHCMRMGAAVGIVTEDADVEENAISLGIPVFKTVGEANRSIWRRNRNRRRRLNSAVEAHKKFLVLKDYFRNRPAPDRIQERFRKQAFITGISAVLFLFLFIIPSAEVYLKMAESEQNISLQVWASPEIITANVNGGIPAHVITVEVDGQDQIETTGNVSYPDQFSTGKITFINLTDQTVLVPAGTVVMTLDNPGKRFETTNEALISKGIGERVEVAIKSQQPGQDGNVGAGQIKAVAGDIGLNVLVDNIEATTGGVNISSMAPSKQDYDGLRQKLMASLEKKALQKFENGLASGERLFPQTLKVEKVIDEKIQPEIGLPGSQLLLQYRVKYSIWTIRSDELETMIQDVMNASLTSGSSPIQGSPTVFKETTPELNQEGLEWHVTASRNIRASLNETDVISSIIGKRPGQANKILAAMLQLSTPPTIRMNPFWWPRVPLLPFQIHLVTQ